MRAGLSSSVVQIGGIMHVHHRCLKSQSTVRAVQDMVSECGCVHAYTHTCRYACKLGQHSENEVKEQGKCVMNSNESQA